MKLYSCPLLLLVLFLTPPLSSSAKDRFLQQTNIDIRAELIDTAHTLTVDMELEYINNSPDTLHEIYMHLWANAYKNNRTAFAQQLIESGNYDFHFAEPHERGGYSHIQFESQGNLISWGNYKNYDDIAVLHLNKPLLPSDTMVMDIHYSLVFPDARFSRLGHHNHSFYATQWYPKPAVYNHEGWHPMPYLHRGEFFSEFGDIQVSLTLPENYIVASTGILQDEKEKKFLRQLARATTNLGLEAADKSHLPPPSSAKSKTIRFQQKKVHDFAWFADKQFRVLADSLILSSGDIIMTYAFFTHQASLWFKANSYLVETMHYMSDKLGPYPWKQITAVQGIHSGGANMEYPAITVIGEKNSDTDLEKVIIHEAVHNWFYGILASNERKEPWIDEGFTTYYETRLFEEKYPEQALPDILPNSVVAGIIELSLAASNLSPYFWYMLKAAQHLDQPPGAHAKELSELNYYAMVYFKASMAIQYLESYLGSDAFDRIMKSFYQQWQFNHPSTSDIATHFRKETAMNLHWFFNDLVGSDKKIDLKLSRISTTEEGYLLDVKNRGEVAMPFAVSAIREGETKETIWFEGFPHSTQVFFPGHRYDSFTIDSDELIPEINRTNNTRATSTRFKKPVLPELQLLAGIKNPAKPAIYFFPVAGFNANDGLMPGIAFYNYFFPVATTDAFLMPFYSTNRDDLSGTAWLYQDLYPGYEWVHSLRMGAKYKRYGLSKDSNNLRYTQLENSLTATFKAPLSSSRIHSYLKFTNFFVHRQRLGYAQQDAYVFTEKYYVNRLDFVYDNQKAFNAHNLELELLQADEMLRSSITARAFFPFTENQKGFHLRAFAGTFLIQPTNPGGPDFRFSLQGSSPARAALYDATFIGYHRAPGTLWGNQTTETKGGFRYPTPLGLTWNWLASINMAVDLPALPLRAFFDTGTYHRAGKDIIGTQQFPYVAGVQLTLMDDLININFPVLASGDIKKIAGLNKLDDYVQKITFSIQFDQLNLMEMRRRIHLLLADQ